MRPLRLLSKFRSEHPSLGQGDDSNGYFVLAAPTTMRVRGGRALHVIASVNGEGWDHVSVSASEEVGQFIPTWVEMEYVRRLFFKDDETVMQLHPPLKDYVNCHPCVLHLWRPTFTDIPRPSKELVGGGS